MDPEPINQNPGPESTPKPAELAPAAGVEQGPAPSPERAPASPERSGASGGMSLPRVQPPAVPVVSPVPVAKPAQDDDDDTPAIADDVDVIEMEWVNQAKKAIRDNKDNPHAQEEAVEKLQRNYLKKRYGRDLKSASK